MKHVPSDPLIGRTIEGRYLIEKRIARGGMAVVYEGVDNRLHRKVAIKVMHAHLADDEDFRQRFEGEARNAALLTHPNLVSVLDQGEDSGIVFLVMENVSGITLRDLLKKQHSLRTDQAIEISKAMLAGLSAAHKAGIIHRDLKPENVLLADDGRIKLGDFGLARAAGANTSTGQALLGTIAYLPPELLTEGVANKQSDIYSFGIMLYEMLTGEQPFTGEQPMQVAYKHANEETPAPSSISKDATYFLDQIVAWCTKKDPTERPEDATELLAAFNENRVPNQEKTTILSPGLTISAKSETTKLPREAHKTNSKLKPKKIVTAEQYPQITKAVKKQKTRKVSRFFVTLFFILLIGAVFSASWWKFLGPGSDVLVPNLKGLNVSEAKNALAGLSLNHSLSECFDTVVEPGNIVSTQPAAGERVKRETTIDICESVGPESISTPELIGLSLEEAEETITSLGFSFGGIYRNIFGQEPLGTVLNALTPAGEPLPELYPELAEIWVSISAGPIPEVSGLSISEATENLEDAGLIVDTNKNGSEYSDTFERDSVIGIVLFSETIHVGDSVALNISLGPELFEVPDVTGFTVREAMGVIQEHGFVAKAPWYLNEAALDAFTARGTTPGTGDLLPLGAEVEVLPKLF